MELQRERDAWFTIRGYVYQVDVTIDRWLDLRAGQVLELERGEDIDLVGRAAAARGAERERLLEQVKHLQSSITLRSAPARAFLANARAHQSANPSASLTFRFTTTAAAARERSTPVPGGTPGIEVWERIRAGVLSTPERHATLAALRRLLASRTPPGKLPAHVWREFRDFLARSSDDEMAAFVGACEWACGGVPADWYAERLRRRLAELGYAPDERRAAPLYDRLFAHAFRTLTQAGLKSLSRADLETQVAEWRGGARLPAEDEWRVGQLRQLVRVLEGRVRALESEVAALGSEVGALKVVTAASAAKLDGLMRPLPRFRSNVPARNDAPFVGREGLLDGIAAELGEPGEQRMLVLHGPSGAGKSELAREFARRNRERYPGGTFVIAARGGQPVELALIGKNVLDLEFPADLPLADQCMQTLLSLGGAPVLLIYDNVLDPKAIDPWLPPHGMPSHLLVTTVVDNWRPGVPRLEVEPLGEEVSLRLVGSVAGPELAERFGAAITARAGGLPVQLLATAAALLRAARRDRLDSFQVALAPEAAESFQVVYDLLDDPVRMLLHAASFLNGERIPRTELERHLQAGAGVDAVEFLERLDVCLDLHLLEGGAQLRMHQLLATFVTGRPAPQPTALAAIRRAQRDRFVALAAELEANPSSTEVAAAFLAYPLSPDTWRDAGAEIAPADGEMVGQALIAAGRFGDARLWLERAVSALEAHPMAGDAARRLANGLHHVGVCLREQGAFDEALSWLQRAGAEKRRPNVEGRVDHAGVGETLHEIGLCLTGLGRFGQARERFEEAVAEKRLGDLHHRVDHDSVGLSLHEVGFCLSQLDDPRNVDWYVQAVGEKLQGDMEGRVDALSVGSSMYDVGFSISEARRFPEAAAWLERALGAVQRGDVHGRIDYELLGKCLQRLGYCMWEQGRFQESHPWYVRAAEAKERGDVHGRVDSDSLGISLHSIGDCLTEQGRFGEAIPWYQRSVGAKERGDLHGRVDPGNLGVTLHQVGWCLSQQGRFAQALPWYQRAVEAKRRGNVHGRVDPENVGSSLHQLGWCFSEQGDYAAALPWYQRAAEEKAKGNLHGTVDPGSVGVSVHQAGICLSYLGRADEALACYRRAVELKEQGDAKGRVDQESLGTSLHEVGFCLSAKGRFEEAIPWYMRAVQAKEKGDPYGRVSPDAVGGSLHQVGWCLSEMGRYADALPWYQRAAEAKQEGDEYGRVDHQSVGLSLHQLGWCLSRLGRPAEALPWFERAVQAKEKGDVHGRVDHDSLGASLHDVGFCRSEQGRYAEALPWLQRAVRAKEQGDLHGRILHDSLGISLHQVGFCLAETGALAAAVAWFERAVAAKEQGDAFGAVDHESLGPQPSRGGVVPVAAGPADGGA